MYVDNVTHAFVGAAMAECAVPRGASARTRTVFLTAGVVAANAPDVDLLYTGITEAPLGYLLHHRGHSHTLPGLAVARPRAVAGLRLLPWVRAAMRGTERRWILLIAAALLGHLLMDTANGYGTHLFYPFSARWIYGDAVFVLEPWLWVILGATLALNASRLWRVLVALLALGPLVALVSVGLLRRGCVDGDARRRGGHGARGAGVGQAEAGRDGAARGRDHLRGDAGRVARRERRGATCRAGCGDW